MSEKNGDDNKQGKPLRVKATLINKRESATASVKDAIKMKPTKSQIKTLPKKSNNDK